MIMQWTSTAFDVSYLCTMSGLKIRTLCAEHATAHELISATASNFKLDILLCSRICNKDTTRLVYV